MRAEERTKKTAGIYNDLGLPEYYGLKASSGFRASFEKISRFRRDSSSQNAPNRLKVHTESGKERRVEFVQGTADSRGARVPHLSTDGETMVTTARLSGSR